MNTITVISAQPHRLPTMASAITRTLSGNPLASPSIVAPRSHWVSGANQLASMANSMNPPIQK